MICKNCGVENNDDNKFCFSCGTLLSEPPEELVVDEQTLSSQKTIICDECGVELEESDKFCKNCGRHIEPNATTSAFCPFCGNSNFTNAKTCIKCGKDISYIMYLAVQRNQRSVQPNDTPPQTPSVQPLYASASNNNSLPVYSMKFHKFLMVWLVIEAVYAFYQGIVNFYGAGFSDYLLERVSGLRAYTIFAGIIAIACAVSVFIARVNLSDYRTSGINSLVVYFCITIVGNIIMYTYLSINDLIWYVYDDYSVMFWLSMLAEFIFACIVISYYQKRSSLFVH